MIKYDLKAVATTTAYASEPIETKIKKLIRLPPFDGAYGLGIGEYKVGFHEDKGLYFIDKYFEVIAIYNICY